MPEGDLANFKLVEPGDFVISLRSFQGGIELSRYRGLVSPAYTVLRRAEEVDEEFFKHLFKSPWFINRLSSAVIGIRDGKQISYSVFSELLVPKPPLPEQRKIAAILTSVDHAKRLVTHLPFTLFGHELVTRGVSLDVVAQLMGHVKDGKDGGTPNPQMTSRYTLPDENDLQEAVEQLSWV